MHVIENLSIAHDLSVFGIEVEIDTTDLADAPQAPQPLETLTVKALRDIARGQIKGFSKLSKAQLIAAIHGLSEPRYTALQVATAQAKLNMLPTRSGGRKAHTTRVAA